MPAKRAKPGGHKGSQGPPTSKRSRSNATAVQDALTYRIRRIPCEYKTLEGFAMFLTGLEPRLGPSSNIDVYSLAKSLDPYDQTKVATVMFKERPEMLADGKDEWTIPFRSDDRTRNFLVIDLHFRDFTVLNDAIETDNFVDCIAISGLASHAFGSWRCRSMPAYIWLRDQLPVDIKNIRVILYGYDSRLLQSESFQTLPNIATTFKAALCDARGRSANLPPTIFIAHSLGGLVVKHALVQLANDTGFGPLVSEKVKSILFFGTPSKGMNIDHLQAMVSGQVNEQLIQQLAVASPSLKTLEDRFKGIANLLSIKQVSFYETMCSPTAKMDSTGQWSLTGPPAKLVSEDSAIQEGSPKQDQHPVNKTHSDLAKLEPYDSCYRIIRGCISDICDLSLDQAKSSGNFGEALTRPSSIVPPRRNISNGHDHHNSSSQQILGKVLPRTLISKIVTSMKERFMSDDSWRNIHASFPTVDYFAFNFAQDAQHGAFRSQSEVELHHLADTVWKSYNQELRERMRQSLLFEDQHARLYQVVQAAPFTFEWVFTKPCIGLKDWLSTSEHLYWIRGKPGSGKSTLLKYVLTHPNTKAASARPNNTRTVLASYFFHDRGSQSQKSLEGLVQSIVSQILDEAPELEKLLLPIFVQAGKPPGQIWPLEQSKSMLHKIITQEMLDLHTILFLDALDEFYGDKIVLCTFIFELMERTKGQRTLFRICFASRPETIFLDEFEKVPGFDIHQHTQDDIAAFLRFKLRRANNISRLLYPGQGSTLKSRSIVDEIQRRARGVFLWVSLTVEELSRAATDGVTSEQLDGILLSIPDELSDFYTLILSRVKPRYRRQLYCMLETATRQDKCPAFIFDVAVRIGSTKSVHLYKSIMDQYTDPENMPELYDSLCRRLHSRTGGLLEINNSSTSSQASGRSNASENHHYFQDFCQASISFLHQTVKEFLTSGQVLLNLLDDQDMISEGNGHTFISKATFLALQVFQRGDLQYIMPSMNFNSLFLLHAQASEQSTGLHQAGFYSSFEKHICFNKLKSLFSVLMFSHTMSSSQLGIQDILCEDKETRLYSFQLQGSIAVLAGLELLLAHVTEAAFSEPAATRRIFDEARHTDECRHLLNLLIIYQRSSFPLDENFLPPDPKNLIVILMKHAQGAAGVAWRSAVTIALKTRHKYDLGHPHFDERRRTLHNIETMLLCGQDPNAILWLDLTALAICKALAEPCARNLESILLHYGATDQPTEHSEVISNPGFGDDESRLIEFIHAEDGDVNAHCIFDPRILNWPALDTEDDYFNEYRLSYEEPFNRV